MEFLYAYDVLGRKTSVSAAVGSTDDHVNAYSYDGLGRITQITQDGVTGGNAVAEKRLDFGYSDDGTRATISRFADLAGTKAVAETEKVFDELGRVTDIVHERAATDFADYDLTRDAAGRITDFELDSLVGDDGDAAYSYDDTNQLTASDYASDWQTDESYTYDDNGNRTNTGYTTGDHNRLTSDGTYNYTYDNEGNVLTKTNISTSESVEYTWDHRNRLTKVTFKNSGGTATEIVEYAYDHGQRWVRKTLDTDADGTIEESRVFVHDNGQIVLDFQKTGTTAASNSDLANRYLWGTNVDELLTDELVDDGTEDDNRWALMDHLNSVRDLVVYNPVSETVSVVKHVAYDAFGNVTSDSAAAVKSLFLYTARPFDADTDLQNNLNRWYDLSTGRWMSVDPIGFEAGDVNLYRYIKNRVSWLVDPMGLKPPYGDEWTMADFFYWYYFGNGQQVDLKDIGIFEPWFKTIEQQLFNIFKRRVHENEGVACDEPGTFSRKVRLRNFKVEVDAGKAGLTLVGKLTDVLTALGGSKVLISGSCDIEWVCQECCDGSVQMEISSGSCDLNFRIRDKFQNPLDKGGHHAKEDWPFAKPYPLVAVWDDRYEWFDYDPCPENQASDCSNSGSGAGWDDVDELPDPIPDDHWGPWPEIRPQTPTEPDDSWEGYQPWI